MEKGYQDITVEEVQELMRTTREHRYQLVDVRQPEEYTEEHLAGAILIPVGEIDSRFSELSPEKATIFYCRSGKRSVAASVFASTGKWFTGTIYNMLGGILEWDGEIVPDMPNIKVFDISGSEEALLYQAMNLEKGAHRFYQLVLDLFENAPFAPVMEELVTAEEKHAKMIYDFWKEYHENAPSFEEVYDSLPGDILEGGQDFDTLTATLKKPETQCQDIIDMAILIEFSAYDLYRTMAHKYKGTDMEKPFTVLSQSEKDHMRIAAEALALCR